MMHRSGLYKPIATVSVSSTSSRPMLNVSVAKVCQMTGAWVRG